MKLNFINCKEFEMGTRRLQKLLDFEISNDGIVVEAICTDYLGASLENGKGKIFYAKKNHFFRALGIFVENMRKGSEFNIREDIDFDTVGVMLSANLAAQKVEAIFRQLDYLAVMGYNMVMIYTEDNFELPGRPFFGYMRGKYTVEELRHCDDYAYEYGIEMIPCIELYGHMAEYLQWEEANDVKDTSSVLLAESEKTTELLDLMIRKSVEPFRSKRIHIGMDEAWNMGRGKYLDIHGYVPPFEIFNRHMDTIMQIVEKHGLTAMMWSDMYFRMSGEDIMGYYDTEVVVPPEIREKIPEKVQLVYWHYGEEPGCDDKMIQKHKELERDVIFAGGIWAWTGHLPENHYTYAATNDAIKACRKNNVREMMTTIWGGNLNFDALLLGLSFTAEMVYNKNATKDDMKARFEGITGGDWQAFFDISSYHNIFDENEKYPDFNDRFYGMPLFWQDILEGIYDDCLFKRPMSTHYKGCAEKMKKYGGKFSELYEYATALFECLAVKTEIAEKLKPAYDAKDLKTLENIRARLLPELVIKLDNVYKLNREQWFRSYKTTGWKRVEYYYCGLLGRCETAILLLGKYLNGEIDAIDELEENRLPNKLSGFAKTQEIIKPFVW